MLVIKRNNSFMINNVTIERPCEMTRNRIIITANEFYKIMADETFVGDTVLSDLHIHEYSDTCALTGAHISDLTFKNIVLHGVQLCHSLLNNCSFFRCDFERCNLGFTELHYCELKSCDFKYADFTRTLFVGSHFNDCDMSQAKGLISQSEWIKNNLEATSNGYICYKSFNEYYSPPNSWHPIELGKYVEENVNTSRTSLCSYGVNIGTLDFAARSIQCIPVESDYNPVYECLIEFADLADVVVPFNTDGKFRAGRVKILRKIDREELAKAGESLGIKYYWRD